MDSWDRWMESCFVDSFSPHGRFDHEVFTSIMLFDWKNKWVPKVLCKWGLKCPKAVALSELWMATAKMNVNKDPLIYYRVEWPYQFTRIAAVYGGDESRINWCEEAKEGVRLYRSFFLMFWCCEVVMLWCLWRWEEVEVYAFLWLPALASHYCTETRCWSASSVANPLFTDLHDQEKYDQKAAFQVTCEVRPGVFYDNQYSKQQLGWSILQSKTTISKIEDSLFWIQGMTPVSCWVQ